jgi:hypothetical protein
MVTPFVFGQTLVFDIVLTAFAPFLADRLPDNKQKKGCTPQKTYTYPQKKTLGVLKSA